MKKNFFGGLCVALLIAGAMSFVPPESSGPVCPDGASLCANDAHGHIYHKGNPVEALMAH